MQGFPIVDRNISNFKICIFVDFQAATVVNCRTGVIRSKQIEMGI